MNIALGIIGVFGMLGGVISSGVDSGKQSGQIRDQIDQIHQQTVALKTEWERALGEQQKMEAIIQSTFPHTLDEMAKLQDKLRTSKAQFVRTNRTIKLFGIGFISVLFFILLMKRYGISAWLNSLIKSGFKSGYNNIKSSF